MARTFVVVVGAEYDHGPLNNPDPRDAAPKMLDYLYEIGVKLDLVIVRLTEIRDKLKDK